MIHKIIDGLINLRVVRTFKLNTTPRWVILLVDMLIVLASYALVVVSDMYAHNMMLEPSRVIINCALVMAVYLIVSVLTKSYTCVIRLSVIEDLYRTIMVVVFSSIILLAIDVLALIFTGAPLYRFWNVLVIGAITFSIMMVERLLIKYFYMRLTAASKSMRRRVLVLGTSLDSLILANALKSEIGGRYEPVGLLSIKEGKENEAINGFNVYRFNADTVANIFVENGIYALIFSSANNDLMRSGFADHFIRNNITLLSINRIEEFELDEDKDDSSTNISTFVREVQIEDLLGRDPIVLNNTLVNSNIQGACVLITGACGSIGSEIVRLGQIGRAHV